MPGFDNFDEGLNESTRQAEGTDANVQPWQAALKPGDFCVVLHGAGVNYIEVLEAPNDDQPPMTTNQRWTRGYSQGKPTGELGTLEVSVVDGLLNREQFERALRLGWPGDPEGFASVVEGDPGWSRGG